MQVEKIGIIGLDPMGKSLSLNMMDKGIDVIGFGIDAKARDKAKEQGIKVVSSLKALIDSFGQ